MRLRYFAPVVLFLLSLFTMNFQCRDKFAIKPFENRFEAAVDISPLKKTYTLNDTIWIETDVPGKFLFDLNSNQNINADTGKIDFYASFNEFGTYVQNPPNGFCTVVTQAGVNADRQFSQWGTSIYVKDFGCGQPDYKIKIGLKPNVKGSFWLILGKDRLMGTCTNKVVPYYASISYKYKNVDLGLDVFNALSTNDKGGNDGIVYYTNQIRNREIFVFSVQ
jgi:hypothetical protein